MENESSKNRGASVFFGVVFGLAVGFVIGFIVGINTRPLKVVWIIVGLVCLLIAGIGIYRFLKPGRKNG
jgi:ribose/xylose/arabinose/galactoside ABC-type transport system permease subunit